MKTHRRFKIRWIVLVTALALLTFAATGWGGSVWDVFGGKKSDDEPMAISNQIFADLVTELKPAVVNISTTRVVKQHPMVKGLPSPFGEKDPFR